MKTYLRLLFTVLPLLLLVVLTSCEEDEPVELIIPKTDIFLNGGVNNGTLNFPLVGAIALGLGEVAPFFVSVSEGVTFVEVSNRYTLPAPNNATVITRFLGSFPVSAGKAEIPAILISDLRNVGDPLITTTGNRGVNAFLIDAVLADESTERRIFPLTLDRTYVNFDNDPFKVFLDGDFATGVKSFTVKTSGDVSQVRVTNRYALPNTSATNDQLIGLYNVDPITKLAIVPESDLAFAKMRQATDPAITGSANIGLNTLRVEALFISGGAPQLKTALIYWK